MDAALKECLEVYRRSKTVAETEGNSSKARRYGRICKQFEDALKLHSKGKPVPLDELPVPPGFPPLMEIGQSNAATSKPSPEPSKLPETAEVTAKTTLPEPVKPSSSKETTPVAPPRTNSGQKNNFLNVHQILYLIFNTQLLTLKTIIYTIDHCKKAKVFFLNFR